MPRLILFDIDETMIHSDGVGRRAMERTASSVFEKTISFDGHSLSGKTDPQILHEVLVGYDFTEAEIQDRLPRLFIEYLPNLKQEIAASKGLKVHAGVVEVLDSLWGRDDVHLGLLTGNIEPAAREKLRPVNLNKYFNLGAFGSDSGNRLDLPAIAHERAQKGFQVNYSKEDIVIVGDAVADVRCAQHYGVRVLVVATGRTTKQELSDLKPDFLFDSLADTDSVMQALLP